MNNIEGWKKRFDKIQDKCWAMQRNDKIYDLKSLRVTSSIAMLNSLKAELRIAIDNIKFEDESRCLYSLCKSTTANVKLPTFSGKAEEDFFKFKKEFEKGLRSNKVKRDDQVKKLRENLKDRAKSFIPESMESIEDAWDVLEGLYGDAIRTINAKKQLIATMGQFPKSGKGAALLRKQIAWLSDLELNLKEIIERGGESVIMGRQAFSQEMVMAILEYFPFSIQGELDTLFGGSDDGEVALNVIVEYAIQLREQRQRMLRNKESVETTSNDVVGAGSSLGREQLVVSKVMEAYALVVVMELKTMLLSTLLYAI